MKSFKRVLMSLGLSFVFAAAHAGNWVDGEGKPVVDGSGQTVNDGS